MRTKTKPVNKCLANRSKQLKKLVLGVAGDYLYAYVRKDGKEIELQHQDCTLDLLRLELKAGRGNKVFDKITKALGKEIGSAVDDILERRGAV